MVKADVWHEIHSRFRLKEPKKAIARSLGLSVQTVRKVLRQEEPKPYRRADLVKRILTPYEDYIEKRLAAICSHVANGGHQKVTYYGTTATCPRENGRRKPRSTRAAQPSP